MLSLSQTTGYAILALGCLERSGTQWILARDIASRAGIPLPYLSKILHALVRPGLIHAKRGHRGEDARPGVLEGDVSEGWIARHPQSGRGYNCCSEQHIEPTAAG